MGSEDEVEQSLPRPSRRTTGPADMRTHLIHRPKKRGVPNNDFVRIEKVLTRANRALEAIKIEQKERGMIIADWVRVSEGEAMRLAKQTEQNSSPSNETFDKEIFKKARLAVLQILKTSSPRNLRV